MAQKTSDDFPGLLTRFRERKGLSKTSLARELDLSVGYIYSLEKGRTPPPTLERVDQLASVLGLNEPEHERLTIAAASGRTGPAEARVLQQSGPQRVRSGPKGKGAIPNGVDLKHCQAVAVISDAMSPVLQPGQVALCDTRRQPVEGELTMARLADGAVRFGHYFASDDGVLLTGTQPRAADSFARLTKQEVVQVCPVVGVLFDSFAGAAKSG